MYQNAVVPFDSYQLIDCGNGYKLEQFGSVVTLRPEPQALWSPSLAENEWYARAHASFRRDTKNPEKGEWKLKPGTPDHWSISYQLADATIHFKLKLTGFKHVGIFPEQTYNWKYIHEVCKSAGTTLKVLNLFAYTGGATIAAALGNAEVWHVDAVRQVVQWASENASLSGIKNTHWVVEDALKFVQRELKRGHSYQGIILDPPAYGRGPEGEKWLLEDHLNLLLGYCKELLVPQKSFIVLNLYSMGLSANLAATLCKSHFNTLQNAQYGELLIADSFSKELPLGVYFRAQV